MVVVRIMNLTGKAVFTNQISGQITTDIFHLNSGASMVEFTGSKDKEELKIIKR